MYYMRDAFKDTFKMCRPLLGLYRCLFLNVFQGTQMITFKFIFQLSEHYDNNNPLRVYMTLHGLL